MQEPPPQAQHAVAHNPKRGDEREWIHWACRGGCAMLAYVSVSGMSVKCLPWAGR
jgi:hypothetical protein